MFKKYIAVILAAVLVLLCAACDKNAQEIEPTGDNDSTYEGVSVQILQVETTEDETILHVQWRNDTKYPIMYGEGFSLQRWENDQWVDCPMKDNTAFISIGYQLEAGKTLIKPYALNWAFGELAAGHYRFLTSCNVLLSGADVACKLSAEFDLGDGLDNKGEMKGEFSEPPKLMINDLGEAVTGVYNWSCAMGDGTWSHATADGLHPLQMEKHLEVLSPGNAWVDLNFDVWPDDYTVRCWPGSVLGDTNAKSEAVITWNNTIQLKMADYIYEVTATWNDNGTGYYGTVAYVFYAAPAIRYDVMPIGSGAKLYIAGEVVSLNTEQANTVSEILTGLTYDQNQVCNCQPEYNLTLPNGVTYGIHLEEGYARCDEGQSKLSGDQLNALSAIIDWALQITKVR